MLGRFILIASMVFLLVFSNSYDLVFSDPPLETDALIDNKKENPQSKRLKELYRLEQDKVLVTNRIFRQIFEPYLHSKVTVFITSDAVLNAFHVLFKDSIFQIEQGNANIFPDILRLLWERILLEEKKSEQKYKNKKIQLKHDLNNTKLTNEIFEMQRAAILKIKIIIAIALKLTGNKNFKINKKLKWIVNKEVNRIIKAEGLKMPTWISNSRDVSDRIDYSVFKIRGFYNQSESLKGYYRAFKWCQSVPFRIDRDEELLGILILGKIIGITGHNDFKGRLKIERFFKYHKELFGRKEERDILLAAQIFRDRPKDLSRVREYIMKRSQDIKNISSPPGHENSQYSNVINGKIRNFYIISPFHLVDSFIFQNPGLHTNSMNTQNNGLKMCAALGSEYAREQLTNGLSNKDSALFMKSIHGIKPLFTSKNIYHQYLSCLESLLDKPESDAPNFMSKDIWQIKNCNTVLSGWANFRHTWELHIKQITQGDDTVEIENSPPGFVEPEPEFFARLGDYVDETKQYLDRYHGFQKPKDIVSNYLRIFSNLIARKRFPQKDNNNELETQELNAIKKSISCLAAVGNLRYYDEDIISRRKEIVSKINAFANDIENGLYAENSNFEAYVLQTNLDMKYLWNLLSRICRRLEVITHKQLRGVSLNEKEDYFLSTFGEKLATVMLYSVYSEDALRNPGDNSPGITGVYYNNNQKHFLYAGTGRPRELLILYPYKGREVICRGAIIPFFEFVLPGKISDEQWKEVLDSDERPENPYWFEPILFKDENKGGDPE